MLRNSKTRIATLKRAVSMTTLGVAMSFASGAVHAGTGINFDIEEQTLGQALVAVSKQAGTNIIIPQTANLGRVVDSFSANMEIEEALHYLLAGTSLGFERQRDGGYVVAQQSGFQQISYRTDAELASDLKVYPDDERAGQMDRFALDEIIVTATKRATSLQSTAMALSVLSGDALEARGITNVAGIMRSIPGISAAAAGPGRTWVTMRGITTDARSTNGRATTATYIDDFPLALGTRDIRLVDVSRIEVLKGPQGTLYGQSAMGGALRYITNDPDTDAFSGDVSSYISSTEQGGMNFGFQGHLNVPVTEKIAVRGSFYSFNNDGFIDIAGSQPEENANTEKTLGARLKLKWDINDTTTLEAMYLRQKIDMGHSQTATSTFTPYPTVGFDDIPSDLKGVDYNNLASQSVNPLSREDEVMALRVTKDFGAFDMTLMGARKNLTDWENRDQALYIGITEGRAGYQENIQVEVNTFEARLVSNNDSAFRWLVGAWYEDFGSETPFFDPVTGLPESVLVFGSILISEGSVIQDDLVFEDNEEIAFYGEVGYQFTDKTLLTLGYRRSHVSVNKFFTKSGGPFTEGASLLQGTGDFETSENVNTFKANFEYAVNDDVLLYALATSGYRAGGYAPGKGNIPASQFKSDSLWNYEIGARTSWFDNRLTFNANLFRIDWKDMQLTSFFVSDLGLFNRTNNVSKAKVEGLELEMNAYVTENLSLSFSYGYTKARILEDHAPTGAIAGDRLPGTPEHMFSVAADYQKQVSPELEFRARLSYAHTGDKMNTFGIGGIGQRRRTLDSHGIADLRFGLSHDNGVEVSLFADNLLNKVATSFEETIQAASDDYFGRSFVNRPRTVGVNVGYKF
ncbi:MAG: hypothetical protein COB36_14610 [Alphaproteobacteria bacterium]|nr:MAG: hypothetical protein COB36_14610 [Alphaproteobacteria bacterium]